MISIAKNLEAAVYIRCTFNIMISNSPSMQPPCSLPTPLPSGGQVATDEEDCQGRAKNHVRGLLEPNVVAEMLVTGRCEFLERKHLRQLKRSS